MWETILLMSNVYSKENFQRLLNNFCFRRLQILNVITMEKNIPKHCAFMLQKNNFVINFCEFTLKGCYFVVCQTLFSDVCKHYLWFKFWTLSHFWFRINVWYASSDIMFELCFLKYVLVKCKTLKCTFGACLSVYQIHALQYEVNV